jgi:hypothetical protein
MATANKKVLISSGDGPVADVILWSREDAQTTLVIRKKYVESKRGRQVSCKIQRVAPASTTSTLIYRAQIVKSHQTYEQLRSDCNDVMNTLAPMPATFKEMGNAIYVTATVWHGPGDPRNRFSYRLIHEEARKYVSFPPLPPMLKPLVCCVEAVPSNRWAGIHAVHKSATLRIRFTGNDLGWTRNVPRNEETETAPIWTTAPKFATRILRRNRDVLIVADLAPAPSGNVMLDYFNRNFENEVSFPPAYAYAVAWSKVTLQIGFTG